MKYLLILFLILMSLPALSQTDTEQILQSQIGLCVGDNARIVVQLKQAQAKLVELEAKLKIAEAKLDAQSK